MNNLIAMSCSDHDFNHYMDDCVAFICKHMNADAVSYLANADEVSIRYALVDAMCALVGLRHNEPPDQLVRDYLPDAIDVAFPKTYEDVVPVYDCCVFVYDVHLEEIYTIWH